MIQDRIEKFRHIAAELDGSATIVITQMDPDAIGSAVMLRHVLERMLGSKVQIVYTGSIDHPQTQAIFNFFRLSERIISLSREPQDLGRVILVDSSLRKDGRLTGFTFDPVIVIDHHDKTDIVETEHSWVWVEPVGACATLIAEFVQSWETPFTDDPQWQDLATLGALAIATDTKNFTDGVDRRRDRKAWDWFMDHGSAANYGILMNYNFPARYYELLHQVTSPGNCKITQTLLVSHTGLITQSETAFLSRFAELFIRHEQASTVIVWAPVLGKGISIKIRTADPSEDISDLLRLLSGTGGGKSMHGVAAGGTDILMPVPLQPTEENAANHILLFEKSLEPLVSAIVKK